MDETLAINSSQNQNNSALNNLSCGSNNIADSPTYGNSNTINNTINNTNTSFNKSNSTHSKISLRPYQQEALLALDKSHKEGKNRLLISLPTGAGKTIVFANLIANRSLNNNSRSLVIAHRDELIEQAVDKIQLVIDGADIGIVKANNNQINSKVVVASIQTLARESRLAQLEKNFSTIIVDEAHHASANSYLRVLQSLGSFNQNNAPLTVGVTATPERGDKIGLDKVFQEIVYHRSLIEMINQQYLSDLTWQEISLDLDLDKVETRGDDFIESKLIEALTKTDAPRQVLTAFKQYASNRKSLIFVPGVTLARTIATLFQEHNIACESIDGTLPSDERKSILSRLKSGQTQVVVNCMVLTEGFDESSIDCIIFARPTKSKSFYLQMLGRGTRLHPGKKDCLIIDLVGLSYQYNLVSLPNLFGLSGDKLKTKSLLVANQEAEDELKAHQEKEALNLIAELEKAKANAQNKDVQDADAEVVKPRISDQRLVDYVKEDKKKTINFNWLKLSNDCYALSISNGIIFLIKSEANLWSAIYRETNKNITLIGQNLPLEYAQGVAQDFIRNLSSLPLVDLNASWRNQEASHNQLALLNELGISFDDSIDKGQASDLIAIHYAKQSLLDYQNQLAQQHLVSTNKAAINNTNTNITSNNISNFNILAN
ncbi:MAG: DEAD/DEAH box helicase, partial [Blastocatellia bacterium]|nr:DEAD/DEAH box helicase [Blastocatellia bacterium]